MRRLLVLAVSYGAIGVALGQSPATMYGNMESSFAAAQAAASRPGDESLGCDALSSELIANAKDPAVQAFVAKSGAVAQEKMAAINAAAAAGMGTQAAMTIMSSVVPGGAWAGMAGSVAQAEAAKAQAARNMQQQMMLAQEMMTIMPQMMRGQRVIELAQRKDCQWLKDAMAGK
jgi:hypothetical protein